MLEEEIYGETSPIWEADFTVPNTEVPQLVSRPGRVIRLIILLGIFLLLVMCLEIVQKKRGPYKVS